MNTMNTSTKPSFIGRITATGDWSGILKPGILPREEAVDCLFCLPRHTSFVYERVEASEFPPEFHTMFDKDTQDFMELALPDNGTEGLHICLGPVVTYCPADWDPKWIESQLRSAWGPNGDPADLLEIYTGASLEGSEEAEHFEKTYLEMTKDGNVIPRTMSFEIR